MKEYTSQTGGRYTYVDDVINLQNLALAFGSIFDNCENFIISGCEISGTTVSPGYVYINKKIRYFSGASNVEFPCYIYEQNSAETITYANGQDKVGRNIYGCAIGSSIPSGNDQLTNEARQYITLTQNGGLRLNDAFFGTNCLLIESQQQQSVLGNVTFVGDVNVSGSLSLDSLSFTHGNYVGRLYHDISGRFVIQNRKGSDTPFDLIIGDSGFEFARGSSTFLGISSASVNASVPLSATQIRTSNVAIVSDNVYEYATNSDEGILRINFIGYNGGSTKFRDTVIGNGKGGTIVSIDGSSSKMSVYGDIVSESSTKNAFVLKSTISFSDEPEEFLKAIVIEDADDAVAILGYNSSQNSGVLSLINMIGRIDITGTSYVNIGPAIKENGTLLSEKYVLRSSLPDWVFGNAPDSGMTQEMCDSRYARLTNGLSQFIRGANTAQALCGQIGALTQTNADSRYAKLNSYLADMAQTEAQKALIRQNIGAAAVSLQTSIYDSGWKVLRGELHARQWGKVVTIQGKLVTSAVGNTAFVIPAGIAPPAYDVELVALEATRSDDNANLFRVKLQGGQRNGVITHCPSSIINTTVTVALTYMVQ